jgi:hypothetical protein
LFYYFPENYTWSSAFHLALMAGAQFGEMDRWLAPLKGCEPDAEPWVRAWSDMAQQQEDEAALDLKEGYRRSAGARYLRAAVYRFSGERQVPPGTEKSASYLAAMNSFTKAIALMPLPLKRIEVKSPDGILPGYLIKASTRDPAPVVIFYSGFDVVKEMLLRLHHGPTREGTRQGREGNRHQRDWRSGRCCQTGPSRSSL